jgi:hypothetical protein
MHGNEEAAALEGEPHPPARRRRSGRRAQPERLAFELEQLLGVRLTPLVLDRFEHAPLGRRELVDLLRELVRIAEHLPGGLE